MSMERLREMLGQVAQLLDDRDIVEISCNPPADPKCDTLALFVERFGMRPVREGGMESADTDRFVRWCATNSNSRIAADRPIFSGRIPGTAHRIEALRPPVVDRPCFSIRRHSELKVTLEDFIPDRQPRRILSTAIATRKNILIAGATGSGKTTLLNACLHELALVAPQTRLVVIEDTPEIRSPLENTLPLRTADSVGMDRLLKSALRLAPDRIIVGEVRDGHVLMTLIKAWNTGHPGGLATLHANSASEVFDRLRMLATEAVSADPTPTLLQSADMIAFVQRGTGRPIVTSSPGPCVLAAPPPTWRIFMKPDCQRHRLSRSTGSSAPLAAASLATVTGSAAMAADNIFGGGSPLTQFVDFVTGPMAYAVVIVALVITVGTLALGGEFSGFARRMPIVVIAGGIVILADTVIGNLFGGSRAFTLPDHREAIAPIPEMEETQPSFLTVGKGDSG